MKIERPNRERCCLCRKTLTAIEVAQHTWVEKDTVHVKCGDWFDEVLHKECFENTVVSYCE